MKDKGKVRNRPAWYLLFMSLKTCTPKYTHQYKQTLLSGFAWSSFSEQKLRWHVFPKPDERRNTLIFVDRETETTLTNFRWLFYTHLSYHAFLTLPSYCQAQIPLNLHFSPLLCLIKILLNKLSIFFCFC